ncbi:hypothetical protein V8G54_034889, partial [Vigna mungo]
KLVLVHVEHEECVLQVLHHLVGIHALGVQLIELLKANASVIVTIHLSDHVVHLLVRHYPKLLITHLESNTLFHLIHHGLSSTLSALVHVYTPHTIWRTPNSTSLPPAMSLSCTL